jgi:hypothetical protein
MIIGCFHTHGKRRREMKKLGILLKVVAVLQIVLGLGYLFVPGTFLAAMGHSAPQADIYYPLGMLAARFIAYGAALYLISSAPQRHVLWIDIMILIQLIDLAVGIFYTATGILSLSLSGFPMFNALWIIVLLWLWRPRSGKAASEHVPA